MKRLFILVVGIAFFGASPVVTAADDPGPTVNITSAEQSDSNVGVDAPPTVAEVYESPYDSVTIRTTIVDNSSERDVRDPAIQALDYWENNSVQYAGYPVNYTLVDENADLEIELTDDVVTCGTETGNYYGCADIIKNQTYGTVNARVEVTLSNPGIFDTTVHEIGHTLGLEHGDKPDIMNATLPTIWDRTPTSVYLKEDVPEQDAVFAGLQFVSDEVDSVSGDFDRVSSPAEAGVVVKIVEDGACGEEYVSCTQRNRTLSDQLQILIEDGLDNQAVPWHVGYLVSSVGERPDVLQSDTGYNERRSEWWED